MRNKTLKVLVVYVRWEKKLRKTIEDSIFSFGKYHPDGVEVFYYSYRPEIGLDALLKPMKFDIVIFHSIFMCYRWRWSKEEWSTTLNRFQGLWKNALKVLIVQDEQYYTNRIHEFINTVGIHTLLTCCANEEAANILYPKDKVNLKQIKMVLTGYVDEQTLQEVNKMVRTEKIKRDIDIGYRADVTPFALGFQGRLKTLIPEIVNERGKEYPNLQLDIKNTIGSKNTFLGMDWFRFLLRCRTMLGSLGGASIQDPYGEIRWRVSEYQKKHRKATYEEIDEHVLKVYAEPIDYTAISPRCFEVAMTKTCQVLVEGEYAGIFKPGIHYIELKKDFSNLDEVFEKVQDERYCRKLAKRAYKDVIQSGKFTYRKYVQEVIDTVEPFASKLATGRWNVLYARTVLKINNILIDKRIIVSDN